MLGSEADLRGSFRSARPALGGAVAEAAGCWARIPVAHRAERLRNARLLGGRDGSLGRIAATTVMTSLRRLRLIAVAGSR